MKEKWVSVESNLKTAEKYHDLSIYDFFSIIKCNNNTKTYTF